MSNSKYYNYFMFSYRIVRRFFAERFEPFNLMQESFPKILLLGVWKPFSCTTLYYSLKWERWLTFNLLYTGCYHPCYLKIGI